MNSLSFRTFFALALLVPALALADAGGRQIDELMRKSGLWKQVGQIQAQVRAGAKQAQAEGRAGRGPKGLSDDDFGKMLLAMDAAYAPARLQEAMTKELALLLSVEDEAAALRWLSSDLGRKFTLIEEQSGEVENAMRAEREAPAYLATVPKARVDKFKRLADAIKVGEGSAGMMINMMGAIAYGMALADPTGDPRTMAKVIKERLEPQRPQFEKVFAERAIQSFAYVYKDVPDAEIERYVAFAETPAGRRYHDASMKAYDNVMTRASLEMGRLFDVTGKPPTRS